ncbi:tyrosine-type recombinase/integrase [Bacillus sp. ISL-39]|nr:tyrosine-type recombinase/integrase [Bacillus sp. ISL-39]
MDKEVHPHQLRHSNATHLLNNGAPLEVIQSLLGHEKSETIRIYAQLSRRFRKGFTRDIFNKAKKQRKNELLLYSFTR